MENERCGGESVMVWGGVSVDGHTDLRVLDRGTMTAERYRDEVLDPIVRPYAGAVGEGFILVHDNARPRNIRICTAYLDQRGSEVMDWPSKSPGLNPIAHLWDILYRRVQGRQLPPHDVLTIKQALDEEWQALPQNSIVRLIRSMPNRCRNC